jgi:hypothetical protein
LNSPIFLDGKDIVMRQYLLLIILIALFGTPCLGNAEDPTPPKSGFEAYHERAIITINNALLIPKPAKQ